MQGAHVEHDAVAGRAIERHEVEGVGVGINVWRRFVRVTIDDTRFAGRFVTLEKDALEQLAPEMGASNEGDTVLLGRFLQRQPENAHGAFKVKIGDVVMPGRARAGTGLAQEPVVHHEIDAPGVQEICGEFRRR